MKIINEFKFSKWPMPKGKVSCKWVQYRGVYQCYVGGRYVPTASGNTEGEALAELYKHYES